MSSPCQVSNLTDPKRGSRALISPPKQLYFTTHFVLEKQSLNITGQRYLKIDIMRTDWHWSEMISWQTLMVKSTQKLIKTGIHLILGFLKILYHWNHKDFCNSDTYGKLNCSTHKLTSSLQDFKKNIILYHFPEPDPGKVCFWQLGWRTIGPSPTNNHIALLKTSKLLKKICSVHFMERGLLWETSSTLHVPNRQTAFHTILPKNVFFTTSMQYMSLLERLKRLQPMERV